MKVKFEKWHGCKNDFIVIDTNQIDLLFESLVIASPGLCSRVGDGIGADGIILLHKHGSQSQIPTHISIINSDGSQAVTCGNGIRCAALYTHRRYCKEVEFDSEFLEFKLANDTNVQCSFINQDFVRVSMGEASLITAGKELQDISEDISDVLSKANFKPEELAYCNISNEHLIIVSEFASKDLIRKIGPGLQQVKRWPGINVHLIKSTEPSSSSPDDITVGEALEAWTWERGAGETNACGSGACAIGLHALASGLVSRKSWVEVQMPGGDLYVQQSNPNTCVDLAGPAFFVYSGEFNI